MRKILSMHIFVKDDKFDLNSRQRFQPSTILHKNMCFTGTYVTW